MPPIQQPVIELNGIGEDKPTISLFIFAPGDAGDGVVDVYKRQGQNPMSPDRSHGHRRLIDMGFNQKQAVAVLYVISAILGLSAVVLTTSGALKAMMLLLALCAAGAVSARLFWGNNNGKNHPDEPGKNTPEAKPDGGEDKP